MFDSREDLVTIHTSIYAMLMLKASIGRELKGNPSSENGMDLMFDLMADFTIADLIADTCGKEYRTPAEASIDPEATVLRDFEVPKGFTMWMSIGADIVAKSIENNPQYNEATTQIICKQIAQLTWPFMECNPENDAINEEILGVGGAELVRAEARAWISSEEFINIGREAMKGHKAPPTSDEELFGNNG